MGKRLKHGMRLTRNEYARMFIPLVTDVINSWFIAREEYYRLGTCSDETVDILNKEKDKLIFNNVVLKNGNRVDCVLWILNDVLHLNNVDNVLALLDESVRSVENIGILANDFVSSLYCFAYSLSFNEFKYDKTFFSDVSYGKKDIFYFPIMNLPDVSEEIFKIKNWRGYHSILWFSGRQMMNEWCILYLYYKCSVTMEDYDYWLERLYLHMLLIKNAKLPLGKDKRHEYLCYFSNREKFTKPEEIYDYVRTYLSDFQMGNDYLIADAVYHFSKEINDMINVFTSRDATVLGYINRVFEPSLSKERADEMRESVTYYNKQTKTICKQELSEE